MAETVVTPDLTIRKPPREKALEQPVLQAIGLEEVRRLAGHVWTDHNLHDPGITGLEIASYAVTDVAYRASRPIEDLLAVDEDNASHMAVQFPSARTLLTNRPLTTRDYRKLLIDLRGVRNAWLRPAPITYFVDPVARRLLTKDPGLPDVRAVQVRGVYDVQVELTDAVATPDAEAAVLARVRTTLHANRNLCEDFLDPVSVKRQGFRICGEIELEPGRDVDVSTVQARIFFDVQQYLAPAVPNYSLAEMQEATRPDGTRYHVDEIFDGPQLTHGFIKDEEVDAADLRSSIRLSDLVSIVMDVPGVRAVRDLLVTPSGATEVADKWVVPVAPGHQPTLERGTSRMVYDKGGVPVTPSTPKVEAEYARLSAEATARQETERPDDRPIPLGRPRHMERYYSFQNHFPATYGIGEEGLEPHAGARRHALARQLKAYLLFFDQILAGACAQIAGLAQLFSIDSKAERTYFHQVVDTLRGFEQLYDVNVDLPPAGQTPAEAAREQALALLETDADESAPIHDDRRHRFLDHLIARYAERFHEYAAAVQGAIGTSSRTLRRHKCRFLEAYPRTAGERGAAYDYTQPADSQWTSPNVSGLERRLAFLLDLGDPRRRDLSAVPEDAGAEVFQDVAGNHRFRILDDEGHVILRAPFGFADAVSARAAMRQALEAAQLPSAYVKHVDAGSFTVVDGAAAPVAEIGETAVDEAALDLAIDDTLDVVRRRYGREAMFVIENLLLRSSNEARLLRICGDASCDDCGDDDPYSYRVHVILPAEAGRFRSVAFREFAERVIRAETPAHVVPKICWIGADDQRRVEQAYRAWIEAAAGGDGDGALDDLIDALQTAKSVYEEARLADCDSPEGMPRFLLGRQALGTGHDHE